MNPTLDHLTGWLRAHRAALGSVLLWLAATGALLWIGAFGWRAGAAHVARSAELREVTAATAEWAARFESPTAAETQAWERSRDAVTMLSSAAAERLALLEAVSQSAYAAGIPGARVSFAQAPDDVDTPIAEGWAVASAGYSLVVSFRADYHAVLALLDALPPAVEVRSLLLERTTAGAAVELVLAPFQAVQEAREPSGMHAFAPAEWRALQPYLAPVQHGSYAFDLPDEPHTVRDPFSRPALRRVDPVRAPPAPGWTVSMIMITDQRRIAVVDQRVVTQGDVLAGGARVAAIHTDHVIVQDPEGRVRELRCESCPSPRGVIRNES
jgi:hypothetical protein